MTTPSTKSRRLDIRISEALHTHIVRSQRTDETLSDTARRLLWSDKHKKRPAKVPR